MSRAFVNEDAAEEPDPRYALPDRDSPHYPAAAARALLEAAVGRAVLYDVWPWPEAGTGGFRSRDPFDRAWLETLRAALGDELAADPLARAWLDWRP